MSRRAIAGNPQRLEPPAHFSHSSRETLSRCAKSWFLKYMTPAPRRPALWLAGGSAVHEVTELYDLGQLDKPGVGFKLAAAWQDKFNYQLTKLRIADPNEYNWRRSQTEPIEAWNVIGPQFVQSYIDWRQRSPYTIWTTPDNLPAIELDVSGHLPGCPVEIKGYVDRIFHDPVFDQLIIVDLKTSKRPPKSPDQFAAYAALVSVKYGVVPALGAPFMNRLGTPGTPYPLPGYTPEVVGEVFGEAWKAIEQGEFPATPGEACWLCDVSSSCAAKSGPLAHIYDPDSPLYEWPPY